jgi:hypothetical protein
MHICLFSLVSKCVRCYAECDSLTYLQIFLETCCLFLLLSKLEGRCNGDTKSRKTRKKAADVADEDEQRSCLVKEDDVEFESQRVEQFDGRSAAASDEVLSYYEYGILY